MTQKNINIGSSANKGDGDPLRTAFDKINDNFTELYAATGNSAKDISGSIFGDDSTLLVDAVSSTIPAENLSGALPALDGSALTNISVSSIDFSNVTNTPTTIAGYGITDAFDGAFISLSATPTTIAGYGITDAFDGDYNSLSNKPTLPTDVSQLADLTNILFDGDYNSLSNQPTIPTAYTDSDVNAHLNQGTANNNEVLSWTGSDYDWVPQSSGGITDVVSDTTPQLGGDLDLNSNNITGTGNINITGTLALGGNDISGVGGITAGTLNNHTIPGGTPGTFALTANVVEAETDPIVGAVNGIVKADGAGNISAAVAGTDYLVVETIDLATLKAEVAASFDFNDFKTRIAAL